VSQRSIDWLTSVASFVAHFEIIRFHLDAVREALDVPRHVSVAILAKPMSTTHIVLRRSVVQLSSVTHPSRGIAAKYRNRAADERDTRGSDSEEV